MTYPVSGCVFIRDTFKGAFCLFESMASLLPFVDEFVVMDLGSTDGTLEILREIVAVNTKVKLIVRDGFPEEDAGVFATLANELIAFCRNQAVLYYQSDEIWHPDLLRLMEKEFQAERYDLSFWRIQYRENLQVPKWYPHLVHRVGTKGKFNFIGDGMSTDRTFDAKVCSDYGGEWFPKWGELGAEGIKPYVDQMVVDISLVGAFLENIPERRRMHSPFWHEEPHIENQPASQWMERERRNPNWYKTTSPYNLPKILEWHLGKTSYQLRPELLQAIKDDNTLPLLGL